MNRSANDGYRYPLDDRQYSPHDAQCVPPQRHRQTTIQRRGHLIAIVGIIDQRTGASRSAARQTAMRNGKYARGSADPGQQ